MGQPLCIYDKAEPSVLGGSDISPSGNMWGKEAGDSFGYGGLGLSGTGAGGGGKGEGIGLGTVGGIGKGSGGGGSGAGYGAMKPKAGAVAGGAAAPKSSP
ncbi:MAG: hypothetical protein JNL79_36085 [Myxococcales bacterium]|nr:hypothetical protein [Myxococcales bacterium]